MKMRRVLTHTFRQSEIIAFPDRWVTNTPSVQMFYPQNIR